MQDGVFQLCYAHPDSGWGVINTSFDTPKEIQDVFSSVERVNAGLASSEYALTGKNETPRCMFEIVSRDNISIVARTLYGISDVQGRPISFSHGYVFSDSYQLLKNPNNVIDISNDNYADQRITDTERDTVKSIPGAINHLLIEKTQPELIPDELIKNTPVNVRDALDCCHLSIELYRRYMLVVYSHLLSTGSDNNLYVKTDGSEQYARNLMYLTLSAIPYSMRSILSCATYLHKGQHNAKLIFCAELPQGVPQINPLTGQNNVINEITEKRLQNRSPIILDAVKRVAEENQNELFDGLEECLCSLGDKQINTMQTLNLCFGVWNREYEKPDKIQGIIYGWLTQCVQRSQQWEETLCVMLKQLKSANLEMDPEIRKLLPPLLEQPVSDELQDLIKNQCGELE